MCKVQKLTPTTFGAPAFQDHLHCPALVRSSPTPETRPLLAAVFFKCFNGSVNGRQVAQLSLEGFGGSAKGFLGEDRLNCRCDLFTGHPIGVEAYCAAQGFAPGRVQGLVGAKREQHHRDSVSQRIEHCA